MKSNTPSISIVTPTFNSEKYLEETIQSILSQGVDGLEYIIVDGHSTDATHAIIDRYKSRISKVIVEKDDGQYDAINKGFRASSGDIMGWLNSDDVYLPSMLKVVVSVFEKFPEVEWLTTSKPVITAEGGEIINVVNISGFSRDGFMRGENLPGAGWAATSFIQQESTFWRRSLWERAGGGLDLKYRLAGDFDLWARYFQHAELFILDVPVACFRLHDDQRSAVGYAAYLSESKAILSRVGGRPKKSILRKLSILGRKHRLNFIHRLAVKAGLKTGIPVIRYSTKEKQWILKRK